MPRHVYRVEVRHPRTVQQLRIEATAHHVAVARAARLVARAYGLPRRGQAMTVTAVRLL